MKVLALTHRLPYAPNRGDRIRTYHVLRVVARHAAVHLFSLVRSRDEQSHAPDLRDTLSSVTTAYVPRVRNLAGSIAALTSNRPLTHALLDSPAGRGLLARMDSDVQPDVVLAFCTSMVRFALESPLSERPLVFDMMDVDSAKWAELGGALRGPKAWVYRREAVTLARFEKEAARRAFATVVVNRRERGLLAALAPEARVDVVQNGIDLATFRPAAPPSSEPVAVFCGVMNYEPNEKGALWLAREVWPIVRGQHAGARLMLLGSDPTSAIRRLPAGDPSIEVTGTVPDVRPYLSKSAVAAAPLLTSRGVQNKVLEAIAAGLPVVVTPAVADGLPNEALPACSIAGSAEAFAAGLLRLLKTTPNQRRALAATANLSSIGWDERVAPLVKILESAARGTS